MPAGLVDARWSAPDGVKEQRCGLEGDEHEHELVDVVHMVFA